MQEGAFSFELPMSDRYQLSPKKNAPFVKEVIEVGEKKKKIKKIIGFDMVATINKSKVGPDEGKQCHICFKFGQGITNDALSVDAEEDDN